LPMPALQSAVSCHMKLSGAVPSQCLRDNAALLHGRPSRRHLCRRLAGADLLKCGNRPSRGRRRCYAIAASIVAALQVETPSLSRISASSSSACDAQYRLSGDKKKESNKKPNPPPPNKHTIAFGYFLRRLCCSISFGRERGCRLSLPLPMGLGEISVPPPTDLGRLVGYSLFWRPAAHGSLRAAIRPGDGQSGVSAIAQTRIRRRAPTPYGVVGTDVHMSFFFCPDLGWGGVEGGGGGGVGFL